MSLFVAEIIIRIDILFVEALIHPHSYVLST